MRRWSKAKGGQGQVVLLSGEPGIGKSRLTAALLECLATAPHTRLRYFCSPQHTDSALYPIISQMERAAGFAHDDKAKSKLDKLDALLTQSLTPPREITKQALYDARAERRAWKGSNVHYCFDVKFRTPKPIAADKLEEVFEAAPFKRPKRKLVARGFKRGC